MPKSSIWKSCISREIKRFCFTWLALSSKNIFATRKKWRFALNIKVIPWPNSLIYERSTWDVWFWHLFSFSVNLTMILPYILKLKDSTQIIWMLQGNKTKQKYIHDYMYYIYNKINICFQEDSTYSMDSMYSIYFHFECLMFWFMKHGDLFPKKCHYM